MRHEWIAEVCHEVMRAYSCVLGEDIQPPWPDAPGEMKYELRSMIRYYVENPSAGPKMWHDWWMSTRKARGWQHGEREDYAKKRHPWLMEFDKLPMEQVAKMHIVRTLVVVLQEVGARKGDG